MLIEMENSVDRLIIRLELLRDRAYNFQMNRGRDRGWSRSKNVKKKKKEGEVQQT